jgi:hypothetical protein
LHLKIFIPLTLLLFVPIQVLYLLKNELKLLVGHAFVRFKHMFSILVFATKTHFAHRALTVDLFMHSLFMALQISGCEKETVALAALDLLLVTMLQFVVVKKGFLMKSLATAFHFAHILRHGMISHVQL